MHELTVEEEALADVDSCDVDAAQRPSPETGQAH